MQQSEETAAETESQCERALGFERQRGVVELQLLERGAQILVLVGLDGIYTREDHRLDILEAGDGFGAGAVHRGDRIAHLDVGRGLDTRTYISHVARTQLLARLQLELQYADLVGLVVAARIEELDMLALAQRAVEDAVVGYDATERVEHRVEDQGLQGGVVVSLRSRYARHNGLEQLLDALSRLTRGEQYILLAAAYEVYDLILHLVDHGRLDIYLVQHGDDLQIVPYGQIEVRYGLRLNTLRGVHHEQRPLARSDGTRHLIREIDVSRRVDQVQDVHLAVAGTVLHLYGVALDGDALLALEVHVVQHLILHFALVERIGLFEQAVGQSRFTVIDMSYDTKVAYVFHSKSALCA